MTMNSIIITKTVPNIPSPTANIALTPLLVNAVKRAMMMIDTNDTTPAISATIFAVDTGSKLCTTPFERTSFAPPALSAIRLYSHASNAPIINPNTTASTGITIRRILLSLEKNSIKWDCDDCETVFKLLRAVEGSREMAATANIATTMPAIKLSTANIFATVRISTLLSSAIQSIMNECQQINRHANARLLWPALCR